VALSRRSRLRRKEQPDRETARPSRPQKKPTAHPSRRSLIHIELTRNDDEENQTGATTGGKKLLNQPNNRKTGPGAEANCSEVEDEEKALPQR